MCQVFKETGRGSVIFLGLWSHWFRSWGAVVAVAGPVVWAKPSMVLSDILVRVWQPGVLGWVEEEVGSKGRLEQLGRG